VSGDWPIEPVEAAQGSSGVVSAIEGGPGTGGSVAAPHAGGLGSASAAGGDESVADSPAPAGATVGGSPARASDTTTDHAIELDYTNDQADAYPIVLVSYEVACMEYEDQADADLAKSFLSYVVSEEGQQVAADEAGSAPLSADTREALQATIDKIAAGA